MDAPQRQVRPSLRPARDLPAFRRRERNEALPLAGVLPWQELFADLQSLMPLQAFAPSHALSRRFRYRRPMLHNLS